MSEKINDSIELDPSKFKDFGSLSKLDYMKIHRLNLEEHEEADISNSLMDKINNIDISNLAKERTDSSEGITNLSYILSVIYVALADCNEFKINFSSLKTPKDIIDKLQNKTVEGISYFTAFPNLLIGLQKAQGLYDENSNKNGTIGGEYRHQFSTFITNTGNDLKEYSESNTPEAKQAFWDKVKIGLVLASASLYSIPMTAMAATGVSLVSNALSLENKDKKTIGGGIINTVSNSWNDGSAFIKRQYEVLSSEGGGVLKNLNNKMGSNTKERAVGWTVSAAAAVAVTILAWKTMIKPLRGIAQKKVQKHSKGIGLMTLLAGGLGGLGYYFMKEEPFEAEKTSKYTEVQTKMQNLWEKKSYLKLPYSKTQASLQEIKRRLEHPKKLSSYADSINNNEVKIYLGLLLYLSNNQLKNDRNNYPQMRKYLKEIANKITPNNDNKVSNGIFKNILGDEYFKEVKDY